MNKNLFIIVLAILVLAGLVNKNNKKSVRDFSQDLCYNNF
jgi:hypothetical protein